MTLKKLSFLADVDATFHHLLPFGVNVLEKPFITAYNMKRFTIADPDGYNLSFQDPSARLEAERPQLTLTPWQGGGDGAGILTVRLLGLLGRILV